MRPDTTAASGTSSLLREKGDFFSTSFHLSFFAFPNSLPEMTILENACVKIKKEKAKKRATTITKPPPSYHCNISYVGVQCRSRGGGKKRGNTFQTP